MSDTRKIHVVTVKAGEEFTVPPGWHVIERLSWEKERVHGNVLHTLVFLLGKGHRRVTRATVPRGE